MCIRDSSTGGNAPNGAGSKGMQSIQKSAVRCGSVSYTHLMTRMRPELEKKIFVYGPECRMTVSPVRFRKLPRCV